jgi:thiol-disulfide isomerase/thioredoxin
MITKILITFVAFAFLATGCEKKDDTKVETKTEKSTNTKEKEPQKELKQENKLIMTDSDEKTYELIADYRGLKFKGYEDKIILLDFFATWCPPCRAEMPHLVNLQKKYGDKIQIFSVLMEENKKNSELKEFIDEFNLNFPILNSKENFFLSQALGGIKSLPTLVIYDKSGEYFTHFLGAAPEEMLEAAIVKALAK